MNTDMDFRPAGKAKTLCPRGFFIFSVFPFCLVYKKIEKDRNMPFYFDPAACPADEESVFCHPEYASCPADEGSVFCHFDPATCPT